MNAHLCRFSANLPYSIRGSTLQITALLPLRPHSSCGMQAHLSPDGAFIAIVAINSRHPRTWFGGRVGGHLQVHDVATGSLLLDLPDRITKYVQWAPKCTHLAACLCGHDQLPEWSEWAIFMASPGLPGSMCMCGSWIGEPPTHNEEEGPSRPRVGNTATWSPDSLYLAIVQDDHAEWVCVLRAPDAILVWSSAMHPEHFCTDSHDYCRLQVSWAADGNSCWTLLFDSGLIRAYLPWYLVTLPSWGHAGGFPAEGKLTVIPCKGRNITACSAHNHGVVATLLDSVESTGQPNAVAHRQPQEDEAGWQPSTRTASCLKHGIFAPGALWQSCVSLWRGKPSASSSQFRLTSQPLRASPAFHAASCERPAKPRARSPFGIGGFSALELVHNDMSEGDPGNLVMNRPEAFAAGSVCHFAWAPFRLGQNGIGAYAVCDALPAGCMRPRDERLEELADSLCSQADPAAGCRGQEICIVDGRHNVVVGRWPIRDLYSRSGMPLNHADLTTGPKWSRNGASLAVTTTDAFFVMSF